MSASDIIILIVAALIVIGSVIYWIYRKKHGKSGCGGSCSGCINAGYCGAKPEEKPDDDRPSTPEDK